MAEIIGLKYVALTNQRLVLFHVNQSQQSAHLGGWSRARVLGKIEVNKTNFTKVFSSLLLLSDGNSALAGIQDSSVVIG